MVSAELAAAFPALLVVLVLVLAGLGLGVDSIRCTEAARVGARVAARGEASARASAAAAKIAPQGASITVDSDGDSVRVSVTSSGGLWGRLGLPGRAHAEATIPAESIEAAVDALAQ
ncbi:MAG: TadE family type IV pilus minor pilin [Nostocoides sp.]